MNARHRWVKLRLHVYVCRLCGTGRVNSQAPTGEWLLTFHKPSGDSVVSPRVPPCEPGPRTDRVLKKYEGPIVESLRGV